MATDLRRKEELNELTERILVTYQIGRINHLGHCPLPSTAAVVEILQDLQEVIFPGYRRRQGLHIGNVGYYVGDLVDSLHDKLTLQIARALRHERRQLEGVDDCDVDYEALGQLKAIQFLETIPAIREILARDVQAGYEGDPAATGYDEVIFCYPGLIAVTTHRIAHQLHRLKVPFIPRMMTEHAHSQTGIDIHPGANIGPGFFIDHGTAVVIGETTDIASNVTVYQGVTLGALSFPKDASGNIIRGAKRHPTLEDGVVVYANATILGGETVVGAGSVVGAGVNLTKSIPPNTVVTVEKPSLRFRDASLNATS